jgi:general secretion pathway protein F
VPLAVTAGRPMPATGSTGGTRFTRRVFGTTTLTVWTRQLAGLVSSGLPLERALTALADEAEDPRQRELLSHLKSEVNAGSPFARALGTAPKRIRRRLPRGGGCRRAERRAGRSCWSAWPTTWSSARRCARRCWARCSTRPSCRLIALVIVTFLVTYVVPQVASVFTSSKRALPVPDDDGDAGHERLRAPMGLAARAGTGWAVGSGLSPAWPAATRPFASAATPRFLTLPLLGRLARGYNAARFGGTLAMLAGAGVPILKALQAAAETLGNHAMRADALDALVQVREGAPLASAHWPRKKRFPGLLSMFARLGEQTGQLPLMLGSARRRRCLARCSAERWPSPPSWSRC